MADIFISYSDSDRQFVQLLYGELRRFNVRGYLDATDLASGASLSRALREAVENSTAVLVVLSAAAASDSSVMAEVGLAQSLNKTVLPVLAPGQNYDESVPPQLVDRLVIRADGFPIEEVAARVVAAATDTPVEVALQQVQSRARRRQRLIRSTIAVLSMLTLVSICFASIAQIQRNKAIRATREAEQALTQAVESRNKALVAEEQARRAEEQATHAEIEAEKARAQALADKNRIIQLTGQSASLAISPDGTRLAVGGPGDTIGIWDLSSRKPISVLRGRAGTSSNLAYSPDGRLLASANWDGNVLLWDPATGQLLRELRGHSDAVIGLQFAPDGKHLYSRSLDGSVREWDVQSGTGTVVLNASELKTPEFKPPEFRPPD